MSRELKKTYSWMLGVAAFAGGAFGAALAFVSI
jgi:hypothetical protein